jgi:hypothetical protein
MEFDSSSCSLISSHSSISFKSNIIPSMIQSIQFIPFSNKIPAEYSSFKLLITK